MKLDDDRPWAAFTRNELVDLGGAQQLISTGDPKRNNFFLAQVGQPLVQFYGYKIDRQVPITGSNYWPIGVASERVIREGFERRRQD